MPSTLVRACPKCGARVATENAFCGRCGGQFIIQPEQSTTALRPSDLPASSLRLSPGGFSPGTVLGQRYRIVNLLGRGGMGEVYRADDLLLEQTVAVKFLPTPTSSDSGTLNRFRNEVRLARQISHPFVCRVHDIGEAQGLTYLTMEFVDGEDLGSLLRRIGKLPQGKAFEIAGQLCAGLSAAHSKGVIHRDLKPSNIMLDGQGQVRITDFGLASLIGEVVDVRSGTPAYMAPEQLSGTDATERSDIYALGLVIHELLTGTRLPVREGDADLPLGVERVLRRCLERDPTLRPVSALTVAAAFPGADPLALAAAAGETPAPELVASAGGREGLRPLTAALCLTAVALAVGALTFVRQRADIINQFPMEKSSDALAARARELASSLGFKARPVDRLFGWDYDGDFINDSRLGSGRSAPVGQHPNRYLPAVIFWYKESADTVLDRENPDSFERGASSPGVLRLVLDSEGRLLEFQAPPVPEVPVDTPPLESWDRLLAAAGLDLAHLESDQPPLRIPSVFDARAAWRGSWADAPDQTLRVEAAAYGGRPVFFRVIGPWTRHERRLGRFLWGFPFPVFLLFGVVLPIVAGVLAWRNNRLGRGDRRGAFRLAGFAFVCMFLRDLLGGGYVSAMAEARFLFLVARDAIVTGVVLWVLYIAFEPLVRRRAPRTLISWSRILLGRFQDPLVARDILVGLAFGSVGLCVVSFFPVPFRAGLAPKLMQSTAGFLSLWFWSVFIAVAAALSFAFVVSLLFWSVKHRSLALGLFVIALTIVLTSGSSTQSVFAVGRVVVLLALVWYTLTTFGLLAAVAVIYAHGVLLQFPLTLNPSAWYAGSSVFAMGSVVLPALYASYLSVKGHAWGSSGALAA